MSKIILYGATGYTGGLCARIFQEQGFTPVVAARSGKVAEVAAKLGVPHLIFALDDPETVRAQLDGAALLINLAGPFALTQEPLLRGCLAAGVHYLDIAGEVPEMRSAHQCDAEAQAAGVMVMPGAGFGVVPTDIAATLAATQLPNATHLTIAYATEGGASRGTLQTVLKDIDKAGVRRRNGRLHPAHPAEDEITFNAAGKTVRAVYNPWRADLFTAGLSTGIPNIETYSVFPGFVVGMMHGRFLWLRNLLLNHLLRFLPEGPSEKDLQNGSTHILARVRNDAGAAAEVKINGPEAYLFTAHCLAAITRKVLNGNARAGFQTPAIYGAELIREITGVEIISAG